MILVCEMFVLFREFLGIHYRDGSAQQQ
jgi:hypothetical protein